MELSIVIGAYQFIGFHLCKFLLEQGHEVLGADWTNDDDLNHTTQEKQLEIGRNANFSYISLQELKKVSNPGKITLYISWYDFIKSDSGKTAELKNELDALLSKMPVADRTIVLYPIEYNGEERKMSKTDNVQDKIIFLPTIYGPWQPETMVFERGIESNGETLPIAALETEYKLDAIFITDFLACFEDIINLSENIITIKSTKPNQWKLCARAVFNSELTDAEMAGHQENDKASFVYQLKNTVEPELGIELQKVHHKRMQTIGKWKMR
ncbi:hypothetical protein [Peribacillus glennii]|uniref:NAD(P)-dependent oxidoreductase n=1 Tax=Peribacillus glennii TaxID=2303991 RepID=A0A372LDN0_9BACI|nr:hypothetical protein [Peribacillus glennii]RFU64137.1 hypothetical protein D0466_09415 [Peribacillus glennii]